MEQRTLGVAGPVSAVGLGCMGMSGVYGPTDRDEAITTIHAALDAGITLLDSGDFYAMGHNELLVAEALRGRDRDQVVLSIKFGGMRTPAGGFVGFDGRPEAVKNFLALQPGAPGNRPRRHLPPGPPRPRRARRGDGRGRSPSASKPAGCATWGCPRSGPTPSAGPTPSTRWPMCSSSTPSCPAASRKGCCPTTRELGIAVTAYGALSRGLLSGSWSPDRVRGLRRDFRAHAPRFAPGEPGRQPGPGRRPRGRWPPTSAPPWPRWPSPG